MKTSGHASDREKERERERSAETGDDEERPRCCSVTHALYKERIINWRKCQVVNDDVACLLLR